jgi:cyanate permease
MPVSRTADPAKAEVPARAGLVLAALILSAAVANLNLAVANVALPLVATRFPKRDEERRLTASYQATDSGTAPAATP